MIATRDIVKNEVLRQQNPDYYDWMERMVRAALAPYKGDTTKRTIGEWASIVWEYIGSDEARQLESVVERYGGA
jgi:hypothetical protein